MLTHILTTLPLVLSLFSGAVAAPAPAYERDFVITAYYSPLPGQCCYVTGSEATDRDLNGHGTHGADGTPVYPGMVAAPQSYAFGTRITLPGIGIVTVHDRGGAIVEQGVSDRLDIWMGAGEEGLARAMAFGVQRVRGTVHPVGSSMPAEKLVLTDFEAPQERIAPYAVAPLQDIRAKLGDRTWSVRMLQEALRAAGLFDHPITGFYGAVTQQSLRTFVERYGLHAPDDTLTAEVSAYLLAQQTVDGRTLPHGEIGRGSSADDIRSVQRLLRNLGFYDGRTDGKYSDVLKNAILAFQKQQQLVADSSSPGAGRIGPKTLGALERRWKMRIVKRVAQKLLAARTVRETLAKRNQLVTRTMSKGSKGQDVTLLQKFLATQGYFDAKKVNGYYGDQTAAAVEAFQRDRKLVTFWSAKGAGVVGPLTLQKLQDEVVQTGVKRVAAFGWAAL